MRLKTIVLKHPGATASCLLAVGAVLASAAAIRHDSQLRQAAVLHEARNLTSALLAFRALYSQAVVEPAREAGLDIVAEVGAPGTIPLPITMTEHLGERIRSGDGGRSARLYSPFPFPGDSRSGLEDAFAEEAWSRFSAGELELWRLDEQEGGAVLRFAVPDRMTADCVPCHNSHPQTPRSDWQVGDLRGVLEVNVPMGEAAPEVQAASRQTVMSYAALGGLGVLGLGLVFGLQTRRREELEEEVSERTRDLVEARDRAQASDVAKSEFLANMSHEIRTPMNAILGMSDLLGEQGLDVQTQHRVDVIRRAGDHLLQLINEILDFSKIEAGRLEISPFPCDVVRTLEDIASLQAPVAADKGLELVLGIDPALPHEVRLDPMRFRQIAMNLLGNAVKFTDTGRVDMHLSADPAEPGEKAWLTLSVADTGVGIPADRLDTIFDAFSQVDGSVTRRFGGTGLGLSIVRALVELMGGTIAVESASGVGSRFTVRLPIDVIAYGEEGRIDALRGHRVLVVDDTASAREVLESHLRAWGLSVTAVESADDAKALLVPDHGFDAALLDYMMPGTDGVSLASALKQNPETANTPLVLVSSAPPPRKSRSLFVACIEKPLRIGMLREAMLMVLQPEQLRTTPATPVPSEVRRFDGVRVLLVDDIPVGQVVGRELLERLGCVVDVARDGRQAVEMAEQCDYTLIFMDCQMPIMDGYAATQAIRAQEGQAHTPIVALTANTEEGERQRCLAAGMDDFLTKPVRLSALAEALDRFVSGDEEASVDRDDGPQIPPEEADLALQFRGMFLEATARQLTELTAAVTAGGADEVRFHAHRLKGALGTLATPELLALVTALELRADTDPSVALESLVTAVKLEFGDELPA